MAVVLVFWLMQSTWPFQFPECGLTSSTSANLTFQIMEFFYCCSHIESLALVMQDICKTRLDSARWMIQFGETKACLNLRDDRRTNVAIFTSESYTTGCWGIVRRPSSSGPWQMSYRTEWNPVSNDPFPLPNLCNIRRFLSD